MTASTSPTRGRSGLGRATLASRGSAGDTRPATRAASKSEWCRRVGGALDRVAEAFDRQEPRDAVAGLVRIRSDDLILLACAASAAADLVTGGAKA